MARLLIEVRTKIMTEEQEDRIQQLLKEIVDIVSEQHPMSSYVNLDYRIANVDVDLTLRPNTQFRFNRGMRRRTVSDQ